MPIKQVVIGNLGSIVAFSTIAAFSSFQFDGLDGVKIDDGRFIDMASGNLIGIDPAQQVQPTAVTYAYTSPGIDDVALGDVFVGDDGNGYVRTQEGALTIDGDGNVTGFTTVPAPVRTVATGTTYSVDA